MKIVEVVVKPHWFAGHCKVTMKVVHGQWCFDCACGFRSWLYPTIIEAERAIDHHLT